MQIPESAAARHRGGAGIVMAWWDHEELKAPDDRSDKYKTTFPSEYTKEEEEVDAAYARLHKESAMSEGEKKRTRLSDVVDMPQFEAYCDAVDDPAMGHMAHLQRVATGDVEHLREKERTYRGSWKRRGGVGAFMMLARKWDRLEGMLGHPEQNTVPTWGQYDIFGAVEQQPSGEDGTVLAEIRDLRRYLLLVEAELVARGVVADRDRTTAGEPHVPGTPADGGHYEGRRWPLVVRSREEFEQLPPIVQGYYDVQRTTRSDAAVRWTMRRELMSERGLVPPTLVSYPPMVQSATLELMPDDIALLYEWSDEYQMFQKRDASQWT